MLLSIAPKLPMRDKTLTKQFYASQLGFIEEGDFEGYLMLKRDEIELHFSFYLFTHELKPTF